MNRNMKSEFDSKYVEQQNVLRELCREYSLVYYLPNYHADKRDCNTVLIYTKEAHEFNETLTDSIWDRNKEMEYVLGFENTDVNGNFDLNYMNRGKIDLRGLNTKSILKSVFEKVL